jgi:hypothetical protein
MCVGRGSWAPGRLVPSPLVPVLPISGFILRREGEIICKTAGKSLGREWRSGQANCGMDRRFSGPICGLRVPNSTLPQIDTAGFMLVLILHSELPGLR